MELLYVKNAIIKFTEKNMKIDKEIFEKMPKELQDLFELKHDPGCPCYMLDEQSGISKSTGGRIGNKGSMLNMCGNNYQKGDPGYGDTGGASRFVKNIKVDLLDFSMYNTDRVIYLKETICGNILENQKIGGMLNGVIKEAEKYTQSVEQFIFGKSKMENFQKDMKSIISTLIQQMIELKTYNVFLATSIDYFTENCEQIIKLLKEWNTENARNVDNIKHLIIFGNELLELLEDIVRIVQEQNLKNGVKQIENTGTNITNDIEQNINNNRFFYVAKASRKERSQGLEGYILRSETPQEIVEEIKKILDFAK